MKAEEIQKYIEDNCRNEHGEPMMDEQTFYEGAKWMYAIKDAGCAARCQSVVDNLQSG